MATHSPLTALEGIKPFLSGKAIDLVSSLQHDCMQRINQLVQGTEFVTLNLYQIIERTHLDSSSALLHHLASQVWNMDFFMQGLTTQPRDPLPALIKILERDFGSLGKMKEEFSVAADAMIASGWTWLVRRADDHLAVINTYNGGSPMFINMRSLLEKEDRQFSFNQTFSSLKKPALEIIASPTKADQSLVPIIGLNMWEHAYITDYGKDRKRYIHNFWKCVNWNRAAVILNLY